MLESYHLYDEYYDYHSKLNSHLYSDRLIYTRDVTVFKNDSAIPAKLPRENWFHVDVITCAAPYLGSSKYTNPTVLRHLFRTRIKNILEAALDNQVETIVLGAFGCGAFKNPVRLVAEEFKSVIESGQYCKRFKNIVFAIKKRSEKDFGENYWTFAKVLGFSLLVNCLTYDLPEVLLPTGKVIKKATAGFCHLPADKTIEDVKDLTLAGEGFPDTSFNKIPRALKNNTNSLSGKEIIRITKSRYPFWEILSALWKDIILWGTTFSLRVMFVQNQE